MLMSLLAIEDDQERCAHLRTTFNMLPPKHRDCLEFLVFHLARVANRESENLVCSTPIYSWNWLLINHRWLRRILPWSSHLRSCEIIALSEKWPTCMPKTTLCNLLSRTAMRYSVPRKWKHHFIPNTIRLGRRATLHSELYISCFLAIGIWQALCLDEPAV